MFLSVSKRQMWKRALSFARVKLLYSRITFTRFTACYFFFAMIACILLCSLQAVAFADNYMAVSALGPLLQNMTVKGIVVLENGSLQTCTSIPRQRGTNCTLEMNFETKLRYRDLDEVDTMMYWRRHETNDEGPESVVALSSLLSPIPETCMLSLHWLREIIEDDEREDVVTLVFQIWLFGLALVTILNESLPHLGAAFLGHVLNTAWAGYRLRSTYTLTKLYRSEIVPQACGGQDFLGVQWWEIRIEHTIPIVVVNILILVAFVYLSIQLYRVYAAQSFSRVGASPEIHRIYKVVLLFFVCIQICAFFALATAAMWIDKVCHGSVMRLAKHSKLYLAAFIVSLAFQLPWLHFGWICARRECKIRFGIFCAICAFLLSISTLMFFSPLYRYIIKTWAFFATVTITSYMFTVLSSILVVVCKLNFGKGLEHFLRVTDALDGVDFTPVSFFNGYDKDPEKAQKIETNKLSSPLPRPVNVQLPGLSYQPSIRKHRGSSIYSNSDGNPVMLSSSPPLVSELGPRPTTMRSRSLKASSDASHYGPIVIGPQQSTSNKESTNFIPSPLYDETLRDSAEEIRDDDTGSIQSVKSTSTASSTQGKRFKRGLPTNPRTGLTRTGGV